MASSVEKYSISSLTKTERLILSLIAKEKTTNQIADELSISYKTVENHRNNISKKLNLSGCIVFLNLLLPTKASYN